MNFEIYFDVRHGFPKLEKAKSDATCKDKELQLVFVPAITVPQLWNDVLFIFFHPIDCFFPLVLFILYPLNLPTTQSTHTAELFLKQVCLFQGAPRLCYTGEFSVA